MLSQQRKYLTVGSFGLGFVKSATPATESAVRIYFVRRDATCSTELRKPERDRAANSRRKRLGSDGNSTFWNLAPPH